MIVLDTNVVSEPVKARPDPSVLDWLALQTDAAVTAVTIGELFTGVRALPAGRRRDGLDEAVEGVLSRLGTRVLEYGGAAAREHAVLREECRVRGRVLGVEDGMIAAIVRTHAVPLATRNIRDFDGLGIDLIDPWSYTP